MPRITDVEAFEHSCITVQEFANYLTLHENTIRKWIKARRAAGLPIHQGMAHREVDAIALIERSRLRV